VAPGSEEILVKLLLVGVLLLVEPNLESEGQEHQMQVVIFCLLLRVRLGIKCLLSIFQIGGFLALSGTCCSCCVVGCCISGASSWYEDSSESMVKMLWLG
jgi:hypothetical protein